MTKRTSRGSNNIKYKYSQNVAVKEREIETQPNIYQKIQTPASLLEKFQVPADKPPPPPPVPVIINDCSLMVNVKKVPETSLEYSHQGLKCMYYFAAPCLS